MATESARYIEYTKNIDRRGLPVLILLQTVRICLAGKDGYY